MILLWLHEPEFWFFTYVNTQNSDYIKRALYMKCQQTLNQSHFIFALISLCLLYLGIELFFNHYTTLSVDEFWFSHAVYQFKDKLPYRDFAPYKTVLGYYLLLIPMLSTHSGIQTLIFTKNSIALLNAIILFCSSCWMRRFFSHPAILISLALLLFSETMITYSTNIRVDLLGYWFCFFSLLFLLEHRFRIAGLLLGLGFITSQKTLWYIVASNGALALYWIMQKNKWKIIWNTIQLNLIILSVVLAYIVIWSLISSWQTINHSLFYEAAAMYHLDWYDAARRAFWNNILLHNPFLFLSWPLTLFSLFVTYPGDRQYQHRVFIITYAFIILFCLIPYKQVFPYYMQVMLPVFFILYAAFFDWLFKIFNLNSPLKIIVEKQWGWFFITIYIALFIFIFVKFLLPDVYLLMCLIPILLGIHLYLPRHSLGLLNFILITTIFIGGIYPLTLLIAELPQMNGAYQKANIETMTALLQDPSDQDPSDQDHSDYVAGVELFYDKTQPIPGMRHLMGPALDYLASPSEKLRSVMLPALDEDPTATTQSVLRALNRSSVKFYVNNYRMMALPDRIKNYLDAQYEHFWGSIYLYAPVVSEGIHAIKIKFSGKYQVESPNETEIDLNGVPYKKNEIIYLKKRNYFSHAHVTYRLKLLPQPIPQLPSQFQKDHWGQMLL